MGPDRQLFQMPQLTMGGKVGHLLDMFGNYLPDLKLFCRITDQIVPAGLQSPVAIRPGFEKENGRQQIITFHDPQNFAKGGGSVMGPHASPGPGFYDLKNLFVQLRPAAGLARRDQRQ
jgi:hypothetical protein